MEKGMTVSRIVDGAFGGWNAQMAFSSDETTLYVANYTAGIYAYDYNGGSLSNERQIWTNNNPVDPGIHGSLGIAVHHDTTLNTDVLYFPEAVTFIGGFNSGGNHRVQALRRLADNDGDGNWGEPGELNQDILNNIQVTVAHEIDQLQIKGDSLYVAIGTQTVPGNNETAYTGNVNWIEDVNLIGAGSNAAGFDTPSGNGQGQDGYHLDRRPFTSTDPGKLRVYSTGIRNNFGIGFDGVNHDGDLWFSMNQQEWPVERFPDEIHRTFYQADHGFPKWYENQGFNYSDVNQDLINNPGPGILFDDAVNWKTDTDAVAAGFFAPENAVLPITTTSASLGGFDFVYSNDPDINGMMYLTRIGEVLEVDPVTGSTRTIISGVNQSLDALRTPDGNLLVAGGDDIYLVTIPTFNGIEGDVNQDGTLNEADITAFKAGWLSDTSGMTLVNSIMLGDLNASGRTDQEDVFILREALKANLANLDLDGLPAGIVPEPSTLCLCMALPLLLFDRRTRRSAFQLQWDWV